MNTFSLTGLEDILSSCLMSKLYPTPTLYMRTPQCLSLCAGSVTRSVDLKRHENFRVCVVFYFLQSKIKHVKADVLSQYQSFISRQAVFIKIKYNNNIKL